MFDFLFKFFKNQNFKPDGKIVAAKVTGIEKHPNADRLRETDLRLKILD
jgi:tRNA-binding EMAP/Myf-like protein